jgi:hypothetical protein
VRIFVSVGEGWQQESERRLSAVTHSQRNITARNFHGAVGRQRISKSAHTANNPRLKNVISRITNAPRLIFPGEHLRRLSRTTAELRLPGCPWTTTSCTNDLRVLSNYICTRLQQISRCGLNHHARPSSPSPSSHPQQQQQRSPSPPSSHESITFPAPAQKSTTPPSPAA